LPGARDPDCRRAFPWKERTSWNTDLLREVQRYIALRHENVTLRRGDFQIVYTADQVIVYARHHRDQVALVAFNAGHQPHKFTYEGSTAAPLKNALDPEKAPLTAGKEQQLEPRSGYVWTGTVSG